MSRKKRIGPISNPACLGQTDWPHFELGSPHLYFLHLLAESMHVHLVRLLRGINEVLHKEPRYRMLKTENGATAVDK